MEKIFYADKSAYPVSEDGVKKILADYDGVQVPVILRNEHGKPYLENGPAFSVTHSKDRLYIAFSSETVGIDAEALSRNPFYTTIAAKFPEEEQAEILSAQDFLTHWVVKESAVKYMGSSLAQDLNHLAYIRGKLYYKGEIFPAKVRVFIHDGYVVSVCGNGELNEFTLL